MEKQELISFIFNSIKDNIKVGKEEDVLISISNIADKLVYIENEYNKPRDNNSALEMFISSKEIEGCSLKSLKYYKTTLQILFDSIKKVYFLISTEDLRFFLSDYKEQHNISKVSLDNMRRIISTFFTWLENENYISKSPARRIHKIKTGKIVKEVYSDETIEIIRQKAGNIRDKAIVNFLISTGVRVGELVLINRNSIDFDKRECVVLGKGNKQRKVYFDAQTKILLQNYLKSRNDDNAALFVSLNGRQ